MRKAKIRKWCFPESWGRFRNQLHVCVTIGTQQWAIQNLSPSCPPIFIPFKKCKRERWTHDDTHTTLLDSRFPLLALLQHLMQGDTCILTLKLLGKSLFNRAKAAKRYTLWHLFTSVKITTAWRIIYNRGDANDGEKLKKASHSFTGMCYRACGNWKKRGDIRFVISPSKIHYTSIDYSSSISIKKKDMKY